MTITELYGGILSNVPSAATTVVMCLVGAILLTLVIGAMTYLLAYVISRLLLLGCRQGCNDTTLDDDKRQHDMWTR